MIRQEASEAASAKPDSAFARKAGSWLSAGLVKEWIGPAACRHALQPLCELFASTYMGYMVGRVDALGSSRFELEQRIV